MTKKILVIGGGPAGCSSALGLLHSRYQVHILDQESRSEDRVCGAFLNPEGVGHLKTLGLLESLSQNPAVPVPRCRITTHFGLETNVLIRQGGLTGLALPRPKLEDLLRDSVKKKEGIFSSRRTSDKCQQIREGMGCSG